MDVIFRKYKKGTHKDVVFALFPHDVCDRFGNVTSYEHLGQHSSADYKHCISISKKATKSEYKALKQELKNVGYNKLKVVKKQSYDKFLESYKNLN